jgi:hypothetical protein
VFQNNLILINGGAYTEIKKALKKWIDLYSNQIENDLDFKLYKNGNGNHVIKVDDKLNNESFFYLVNYLKYPEGIDYKIDIEGYTTGENGLLKSKKILVFISPNDNEYDNVYVTTDENKNYKVDFGGRITLSDEKKLYKIPPKLNLNNPEILKVPKSIKNKDKENEEKVKKRFKILLISTIFISTSSLIVKFILNDNELFLQLTFLLGLGIWSWLFSDYKMLRIKKIYFKCIILSLFFLIYEMIILNIYNVKINNQSDLLIMNPLTFLILQRPIRKLYIILFNREPEIDNKSEITDIVYTTLLFFSSIILPVIIGNFFK